MRPVTAVPETVPLAPSCELEAKQVVDDGGTALLALEELSCSSAVDDEKFSSLGGGSLPLFFLSSPLGPYSVHSSSKFYGQRRGRGGAWTTQLHTSC